MHGYPVDLYIYIGLGVHFLSYIIYASRKGAFVKVLCCEMSNYLLVAHVAVFAGSLCNSLCLLPMR